LKSNKAWIPLDYQPKKIGDDYLQIDLQSVKKVTAVSTQGFQQKLFVRGYSLMFSQNGEDFDLFLQGNSEKVIYLYFSF